jgi:hypothetical protein
MGTLDRTWSLYKKSFDILSADAEIVFFPVLSAISAILVAAGFFFPLFQSGVFREIGRQNPSGEIYAILFAWYYLNYLVIIFFNSALVGCANIRLSGGDPTMRDGLRIAVQHFGKIACWAFIAATVGVILDMLKNRSNKLIGRLIAGGLGLAWTLITYLIVPVIILEDRTIYGSMERSAELFRKRWGEQIAGSFGFGLLNLLLLLPALAIGFLLFQLDPALAIIAVVSYILILSAISSAVKGIFTVVLYRYASTGELPNGFSGRQIEGALGIQKQPSWDIPL